MFPLIDKHIYAIDIEVKPLPDFDKYYAKTQEVDEESESDCGEKLEVEEPSLYPWFSEIFGIGIAWGPAFDDTCYFTGEDIPKLLNFISEHDLKLCAHNILYDYLHLYYHFARPLAFVADSGVFLQCINNSDHVISFGLKQGTARLYNVPTQEIEVKEYLATNHRIKNAQYGKYIYLCPQEIVSKYCRLDAMYCWKIVHENDHLLLSDISMYMKLYLTEVRLTIQQITHGIRIDREGMAKAKDEINEELNLIATEFFNDEELKPYIHQVQHERFLEKAATYKKKVIQFEEWEKNNKFNINSKPQLKKLFEAQKLHYNEAKQKFEYPYVNNLPHTKIPNPNSPKLGTNFLHAYGRGGKILSDRSEKCVLLNKIETVLTESVYDGRIHPQINMLGTKSGRISASGINIVAAPLDEKRYGKFLLADEGYAVIGVDFSALEPTVFACLSNDPVLRYTTYEGVGKEPFVKDGILWIDDLYLSAAYKVPSMQSFIEQNLDLSNWIKDPELEKTKCKSVRRPSKTLVLSTNYGAGAKTAQQTLGEELKIYVPLKEVQVFQDSYWELIHVAAQYKRKIEKEAQQNGFLVNIGGFPLVFYDRKGGIITGTHKALNRMIQSSAAVCMKVFLYCIAPKLKGTSAKVSIADIHDCMVTQVRDEELSLFYKIVNDALEETNKILSLPLSLRLSIKSGKTFYDIK